MRVGVLTGGGDCPGLNAVIRAVVRKGIEDYGYEFVIPLGIPQVRGILPRGGTILGSSRTNPAKIDGGFEAIEANFEKLGIDALVAIGGEDTLGVASKLYDEYQLPIVGVPKTIDNDLNATDYTFGFDTAVNTALEAIDKLRTAGKIRTSYGQRAASGTNATQCSFLVTTRAPAATSAATRSSNRFPPSWAWAYKAACVTICSSRGATNGNA